MKNSLTNIFDVINPEVYECKVCGYFKQHSYLVIKATHLFKPNADCLYFSFPGVEYFAGPMSWTGATFQLVSIDERAELLKKSGRDKYFKSESISLFVVEQPKFQVKILAQNGYKSTDEAEIEEWPWANLSLEEVKKIDYCDETILDVTDPQRYLCRMLFYHHLTSVLAIASQRMGTANEVETNYAHIFWFTGVEYFAGPMIWRGANFHRKSSIISKRWWQEVKSNETVNLELLLLYEELSGSEVKIVAQNATNYIPNI